MQTDPALATKTAASSAASAVILTEILHFTISNDRVAFRQY